jgi:hypothetical protein
MSATVDRSGPVRVIRVDLASEASRQAVTRAEAAAGRAENASDRAENASDRAETTVTEVATQVATTAAQAAAAAAIDEEILGRDLTETKPTPEETVVFAIVDENDRRSWLEFGPDGGPTEYASERVTQVVSAPVAELVRSEVGIVEQDHQITGIGFVVVDENNRRTDIEVGTDGHFTQRVIDFLSSRIVVPAPADPTRFVLPSTLRLLQGQTYRLNYSDIVAALPDDYQVRVTGPTGSSGNFGGYWQYTPAAAGSWTLTLTLLNRAGDTVLTAAVPVVVYAPIASAPATRLLAIGDSITRPNRYNALAAGLVGAKTCGTRTYDGGATRGEGRGGWALSGYFTNIGHEQWGDSPFLFPAGVPGEKFWGATEFWRKVCYDDPAGYDYNGFQKMARGWADAPAPFLFGADGYPTHPAEGDVVVDAKFAEGAEFRQYVSGSWTVMNPQPAVEFSFPKYMQRYAAAFADGAPTAVSIMLSTNDWFGGLTDAAWATWVSRMETVIASVRAWNATVPVIIIAAPTGGPDVNWGATQTVNKVDFDARMRDVAARQIAAFDTPAMRANKVHVISFLGSVAPENMADHVHPKDPEGQAQFAAWLAGKLAQIITEGA